MQNDLLINAYSKVFTVQGNVNVIAVTPPITYILNRLAIITKCDVNTDIIQCTRNLPDNILLDILFKAVAGDFTTGQGALQQKTCRFTADPITGMLTLVDQLQDNTIVLTIIIIILFVILGWIISKSDWNQTKPATITTTAPSK